VSILDGKEPEMPSWRGKINEEQARSLVRHVRAFAQRPAPPQKDSTASFDQRYQQLQEQMHELQRQARESARDSSSAVPSKPSDASNPRISRPPAAPMTGGSAVRELFQKRCVKCHGADGTGRPARRRLTQIPDFTNAAWQARRNDEQLLTSVLEGVDEMPSWRGRISEQQSRSLVAHVRAFAPKAGTSRGVSPESPGHKGGGRKNARGGPTPKPAPPAGFDEPSHPLEEEVHELQTQSRRLEQDVHDLQTQSHKFATDSPDSVDSKPAHFQQRQVSRPPAAAAGGSATRELFDERCVKGHGVDGTGNKVRSRLAEIPDFTKPSWQARRAGAQLVASVLNGKGSEMPPNRGKISEKQARGLVAYICGFAAQSGGSGQAEEEVPATDESPEKKTPGRFFARLIHWLGKFHPAAVHFPVALLTAAAVAEILRLATGKPGFEGAARFCIWFGSLAAIVARILVWFLARFRLTDASWVMMTHRWLGTSTVACALLVLALGEASRRPERGWTRMCFRVTLLVAAALVSITGFFGGAVVFGIDHYRWP
jgi:mono/diheme cytochrome c family protein/uncharacterized membrane protein